MTDVTLGWYDGPMYTKEPDDCNHDRHTHVSDSMMRGFHCHNCNGWFAYDTPEYRKLFPPVTG
jgi:hypothetical protein